MVSAALIQTPGSLLELRKWVPKNGNSKILGHPIVLGRSQYKQITNHKHVLLNGIEHVHINAIRIILRLKNSIICLILTFLKKGDF